MDNGPIAVFDSGLGGISVLRALRRRMPGEYFLYFGDSKNAPYGTRPTEEIRALTVGHADRLFAQGAKALVLACNTATSAAIQTLREHYPDRVIIGIEPALKLAVSRYPRGKIVVMATEATLREQKFATLMAQYSGQCEIHKCPCPELVEFVERGELEGASVEKCLRRELCGVLTPPPDAIVLGCTHFPFLRGAIGRVAGNTTALVDGADGTARETARRLSEAGLLRGGSDGSVTLTNSLNTPQILTLSQRLLTLEPENTL